ncbi:hypothetical protein [Kitasatospora sp. SUK 42]|uniref:hypothetical protein n=1 Tax=Kitasatospora sp. SUK 42 TaxID=1588882 RepID=UPI001C318D61|nr:hypothetical protein [Kitasatospora sp. SUK 42]MBV2153756.1 hypothetical protein [Kitasatospora sp. SUK 42]
MVLLPVCLVYFACFVRPARRVPGTLSAEDGRSARFWHGRRTPTRTRSSPADRQPAPGAHGTPCPRCGAAVTATAAGAGAIAAELAPYRARIATDLLRG